MSTTTPLTTISQILAMTDDGIDRELIRGGLRERESTTRNRRHAATEANIAGILGNWVASKSNSSARVLAGEVGVVLRTDPDSLVEIDVAVVSLETLRSQSDETLLIFGVPMLAIEILSPSDKHEDVHEKIVEYLNCGVPIVWEVDPDFQTVRVFENGNDPVMFNRSQEIVAERVLPGFKAPVAEFFPDWEKQGRR